MSLISQLLDIPYLLHLTIDLKYTILTNDQNATGVPWKTIP